MDKKRLIAAIALLAVINIAYMWLVWPLLACICRSLPLAAGSMMDLPIAFGAIEKYINTSLLSGPGTATSLIAPETWLGWILLVVINVAALWPLLTSKKRAKANRILDSLPEAVEGNEYGNSRFLRTKNDYHKYGRFTWRKMNELNNPVGGFYLGMSDDEVYMTLENEHMLILAPTRVGKTRRVILQMISVLGVSDESICVFDPKGELYGLCAEFLRQQGYFINRIDFDNPSAGNRWNPLYRAIAAYKRMDEARERAESLRASAGEDPAIHEQIEQAASAYRQAIVDAEYEIDQLTNMVFQRDKDREGNSRFFNDGGENCIKEALHYTAWSPHIPETQKTLQMALKLLQDYSVKHPLYPKNEKSTAYYIPLDELCYRLPMEHPAYKAMKAIENADEQYRASFVQTASGALANYANYALSVMMSGTDVPIENLCDQKTATFIIIPENKRQYKGFGQLYINQMYSLLCDKANSHGGVLPRRMNMIAEEFGQIPTIDAFDEVLSISGGRGIRWALVLQDLAKIDKEYGRDATPVINGNCAYQMLLETQDEKTAKHFSEMLGKYTIRYEEEGSSKKPFSVWDESHSTSGRRTARDLLTPSEVTQWDVRQGVIMFRRSQLPAVMQMPDIDSTPFSKWLGLGSREQNTEKIAAEKARHTHEDFMEPEWRPEYENTHVYHDDASAKKIRKKWNENQAALARERRGLKFDDPYGPGATKPAPPPQNTKAAPKTTPKKKGKSGPPINENQQPLFDTP